jgi:hypothetical protein
MEFNCSAYSNPHELRPTALPGSGRFREGFGLSGILSTVSKIAATTANKYSKDRRATQGQ